MEERDWTSEMQAAYPLSKRDEDWFSSPCDYRPMGDTFGTVVLWVSDDDYEGDTFALYRDGERWGFLTFGWGSCSGCDALQACDSIGDVAKLAAELHAKLHWFESAPEAIAYLNAAPERNEFYVSDYRNTFATFRERAMALLGQDQP